MQRSLSACFEPGAQMKKASAGVYGVKVTEPTMPSAASAMMVFFNMGVSSLKAS
jgi:hypothetical protein